jgi:predicted lactoylglutathione lyase
MATKIFVNLPVKDLGKSINFFSQLGYKFNQQFTDEKAACMVISNDIFAMLLKEDFFRTFSKKEIADTRKATEVINALSADSKQEVDDLVNRAIKAGGVEYVEAQDMGFMYYRSFQDLDGHLWEVLWMDPSAVQGN